MVTVTPTPGPTPSGGGLDDADAAQAADKCQRTINRAGRSFVGRKLVSLDKCVNGVLLCIQTQPGNAACLQASSAKCVQALDSVATQQAKLITRIAGKCSDGLSLTDLMAGNGLGYASVGDECTSEFGTPLDGIDAIGSCVARQHECEVERIFAVQEPRARELLDLVGLTPPPTSCLPDYGGTGEDVGNVNVGGAIAKCEDAIKVVGRKFARTKLKRLEKCVNAVFSCVQTKPNDAGCLQKADTKCDKQFAQFAADEEKIAPAIEKRCSVGQIAYDVLRAADAANLDALAAECALYGVPDVATLANFELCVFRQHACRVEELMRFQAPRIEEMLGIVGRQFRSAFCP